VSTERARRLLSNTMLLTGVRVVVPILSLAVVLTLSRVLGAEGLGQYTLAFTILYVINTAAPFGLYALITREGASAREDIPRLLGSGFLIAACATLPLSALTAVSGELVGYDAETCAALRVLSLSVLPFVVVTLCEAAFVAIEKIKWVAAVTVIENVVKVAGSVYALLGGYGLQGVVIAAVAGKAVGALLALALLRVERLGVALPDRGTTAYLAKTAPTFLMIQVFAMIYWRIDILMLSKLGDSVADVGFYGAAYRIFELVMIVPQSLCLALYPQIVKASRGRAQELASIGRETLRYLGAAVLPAAIAATAMGGGILELLYGGEFEPARSTLAVLVWAVLPFAWVRYHAYVLVAADKQRVDLLLNVVLSALNIGLNAILIPRHGHLGAAVATLIAITCYAASQYAYLRTYHPDRLGIMPRDPAPLLAGTAMMATLYALRTLPVLITLVAAGIVYLGVLWKAGFFASVSRELLPVSWLGARSRQGAG
jgi:O-antigen/teichoic acid export membrane protein